MKFKSIFKMVIFLMILAIQSCEELSTQDSGNLVPKTADENNTIPSIAIEGTLLHSEAFGDPTDPMVVFIHGGPGADYRNGLNARYLADAGYYVVFYDQRGTGLSQRHPKNEFTPDVMLNDLSGVMAYYRTSENQKIFLFGHSWGAILAALYINEHPSEIDGAILAEPGGLTWQSLQKYNERAKKPYLFEEATSDVLYLDQLFTGKENEHEILDYKLGVTSSFSYAPGNIEGIEGSSPFWRYGAESLNGLLEYADKYGFDATGNLDQYTKKVLFLYTENNKAYGDVLAHEEAANFPNAEVAKINDTGHEMIYFGWDKVFPVVLSYLNSLD